MTTMPAETGPATRADRWPPDGLERVPVCPLCGTSARRVRYAELTDRAHFTPGTWTFFRCEACASLYLDPRPTTETIARAYDTYYTHLPRESETAKTRLGKLRRCLRNGYLNGRFGYELVPASPLGAYVMPLFWRTRARADRYVRYVDRPAGPRPHILDVGCGDGAFLRLMRNAGWIVQGIDPDPAAVAVARNWGVPVTHGDLSVAGFPNAHFDAITLSHVIEHIHDPRAALEVCHRLLRPGGVLSIVTPNVDSCSHALFGRNWIGLEPPRHLVLFTPSALTFAVEEAGFEVTGHHRSCQTNWFYRASQTVAEGGDVLNRLQPLPPSLRLKARLADSRARRHPALADEIVLLARKPLG